MRFPLSLLFSRPHYPSSLSSSSELLFHHFHWSSLYTWAQYPSCSEGPQIEYSYWGAVCPFEGAGLQSHMQVHITSLQRGARGLLHLHWLTFTFVPTCITSPRDWGEKQKESKSQISICSPNSLACKRGPKESFSSLPVKLQDFHHLQTCCRWKAPLWRHLHLSFWSLLCPCAQLTRELLQLYFPLSKNKKCFLSLSPFSITAAHLHRNQMFLFSAGQILW